MFLFSHPIKVQLEMLQMDLEDNENAMNSVEELKETIASMEAQLAHNQSQMSEMEACLEESKAQVRGMSYLVYAPASLFGSD